MKNKVIKLFLILVSLCIMTSFRALETDIDSNVCNSSDRLELNTLASYIKLDFEYDEENQKFNVIIDNASPYFDYECEGKTYKYSKKGTIIKGIDEGKRININLVASTYSNCYKENFKIIDYVTPYVNKFLDSEECSSHPRAMICNTKFLNYRLSYNVFKKMLKDEEKIKEEKKEDETSEIQPWYEPYLEYIDKYGMQVFLVFIGSIPVFILGHSAVKRAKSKF